MKNVEQAYFLGRQKWQMVEIVFELYHWGYFLRSDTPPKFLDDYYLGVAAGCRTESAWIAINQVFSDQTRRILRYHATADYAPDDLWADTIVQLMQEVPSNATPPLEDLPDGRRPSHAIRYRAQIPLLHYLITIAKRLAISRHRKHKPVLGLASNTNNSSNPSYDMNNLSQSVTNTTPHDVVESTEEAEQLKKMLKSAVTKLSQEQRFLIAMVYGQGAKQKEASTLLGISVFKASRLLKAAMATLQQAMRELGNINQSSELLSAWESAWSEEWKKLQESEN